jgi:uncharacterized alpha-E superfamily protein
MLSRVADSLYWMNRYLERAEHIARVTLVRLTESIEQTPETAAADWRRVFTAVYLEAPEDAHTARDFIQALVFDRSNPGTLINCVLAARDNARQVREHISGEMWEQLNRQSLRLRQTKLDDVWAGEPAEFFDREINAFHLFHGIAGNTLSRVESWLFLQLGSHVERTNLIARLIDLFMHDQASESAKVTASCVSLLKMCAAFEAYCRVHTAVIRPEAVIEFLALEPDFPRSIRFAADQVAHQLSAIAPKNAEGRRSKPERLAGRLTALLDYAELDDLTGEKLHAFMEHVQALCFAVHEQVYANYIDYPVDTAWAE